MGELKVYERGLAAAPGIELREASDGLLEFRGYAATWDEPYNMGKFDEVMRRGSFLKTLSLATNDVQFYDAHDPRAIVARQSNGTLSLAEDDRGLRVEARLDPADVDVQRLVPKIRSGLVHQMSHGRITRSSDWDRGTEPALRSVTEVELLEVSTVSNPAAPKTSAEVLSAFEYLKGEAEALGVDLLSVDDAFDTLISEAAGRTITPDQASRARTAVESLRSLFNDEAEHLEADVAAEHLHSDGLWLEDALIRIRRYRT